MSHIALGQVYDDRISVSKQCSFHLSDLLIPVGLEYCRALKQSMDLDLPIDPDKLARISLSLSVTVLLEKRLNATQRWQIPSWYLHGVVVGDSVKHDGNPGEKIGESDKGEIYSFGGYKVTLYKDACERYWHALIVDKPLVYVVCREEVESDEHDLPIEPMVVTIDYDEAVSYSETDNLVLSTTIPGELYRYMEAYVLQHYKPQPFKKRKRKKWAESEEGGRR